MKPDAPKFTATDLESRGASLCREERTRRETREMAQELSSPRAASRNCSSCIVLSGEPKIDEPLSQTWKRVLQHYQICERNLIFGDNQRTEIDRQVEAAQQLAPIILGNTKASAKFTEIFRAAPVWLLTFTFTFMDADLLGFDLPHKLWRYKWGRDG